MMMIKMLKQMVQSQKGQGMAEYGLILALVAIAAVAAFQGMAGGLTGLLGNVQNAL